MENPRTRIAASRHRDSNDVYNALFESVAVVDLSHRRILRLSGRDPLGLLDAILSNHLPKEENLGVYGALLSPKGRIQADLRVLRSGEDVMVDTEPEGFAAAKEILGRYAPFSRVKLEGLSEVEGSWSILGVYGPRAEDILGAPKLAEHESAHIEVDGTLLLAVGVAQPVPGYDLIGPANLLRAASENLTGRGAHPAGRDVYETARIKAGIPRFGADLRPENFPGECESFLERAVSFEKGCYPGQETVARMRYRGHPNRMLRRFRVEGDIPSAGVPILQGEKQVGTLTSVAPLRVSGEIFALGYLHRSADPGEVLRAREATLAPLS